MEVSVWLKKWMKKDYLKLCNIIQNNNNRQMHEQLFMRQKNLIESLQTFRNFAKNIKKNININVYFESLYWNYYEPSDFEIVTVFANELTKVTF